MIVSICSDSSTISPGIVISQKTVELELYEAGYTSNKVYIDHQEYGVV